MGSPLTRAPWTRAPLIPHTSADVAQAMANEWVMRNDFGDVIDPWSPTGFAGVVDPRY